MPSQTAAEKPIITTELIDEVLEKIEAQDFTAAVAASRSLVAHSAWLYGLDCILTTRAISLLALSLDYVKPEGRREAETWAHIAFTDYIRDVMIDDGPFSDITPDDLLIAHIQVMREVFADVWDHLDTFQRTGIPDFETGALLPLRPN